MTPVYRYLANAVQRHGSAVGTQQSALLIKYRWGVVAGSGPRGRGARGARRAGREAGRTHSAARRAETSTSVRARGPWSREPMRACSGAMVTATRTACGAWPTCGAPADVSSAPPTARGTRAPRSLKLGLLPLTSAEAVKFRVIRRRCDSDFAKCVPRQIAGGRGSDV